MSDLVDPETDPTPRRGTERTNWQHLADADPIAVRDPLAELLGVVPEREPLVVGFPEVVLAAGHACPAVAGAYRATQLALEALYPDDLPVRSDVAVEVGGEPDDHGLGPMANVVSHVTGADRETGFTGFGGYGGRENLLSFADLGGPGRTFVFHRLDTDDSVRVSFVPRDAGVSPPGEDGGSVTDVIPKLIAGDAADAERRRFYDQWHQRVQRILRATPGDDSPFALDDPEN